MTTATGRKKGRTGKSEGEAVRNQNQWNKIAKADEDGTGVTRRRTADGEDLFLARATAEKKRKSYKDFFTAGFRAA